MKQYMYLDREEAKKGVSLVFGVSETKVSDYKEYFEGRAVEFWGDNLPHYITYDISTDSVRESTRLECFKRGQIALTENEAYVGGEIVFFDQNNQKIVNDIIVDKTRNDYIQEGAITVESELYKARGMRDRQLTALQVFSSNLFLGIEDALTEEESLEIATWRNAWLDVPNNYRDLSVSIELSYPEKIDKIDYYLV